MNENMNEELYELLARSLEMSPDDEGILDRDSFLEGFDLSVVEPDQLQAARAGEVDTVVEQMLRESRDNFAQIENLALECSSALTSAEAKSNGLSEQGLFVRLWNSITGKNDRLRTAIEQDRAVAQYAMQQAIHNVLKECTQNRMLALAVKSRLEGELTRNGQSGA